MPEASTLPERVSVRALGVPVDIEIVGPSAADVAALVRTAWSRALAPHEVAAEVVTVDSADPEKALHLLSQQVTQAAIETQVGDLMMVHAAGLSSSSGAVLALVAPSGVGKTTASLHLGRRFGYVSDETVGFTSSLEVLPYEKPLSMIEGGDWKAQRSPDELGLLTAPSSLRLSRLAVLRRDPSLTSASVEDVRVTAALPVLAEQTSYLTAHERPLHAWADALDACGGLYVLSYADVTQLGPIVEELLT